jgi:multidrug transporter EmrE-like cation transporter
MTPLLLVLFALSLCCDVGGQLCFKMGSNRLSDGSCQGLLRHLRQVLASPWMGCGILVYGFEVILWLAILERAPLSLAFPIASVNFCGVVVASKFLLGEPVSRRRWLGVGLITAGVLVIGWGATA